MTVCLVTGSAGLIGSETARFFARQGMTVVGIDNDMRSQFFGQEASTSWNRNQLFREISNYEHFDVDIRDLSGLQKIFSRFGKDLSAIVHCAAQPSHDWAAGDPLTDFSVNANGTLNLLQCTRQYSPDAVFMHMSTNKVYGDTPNRLPLQELETRFEIAPEHPYYAEGIDEQMTIDGSLHSLFGVSKAAGDLLVQEFGRYFDMKTVCFRGGCLTGPAHSGAQLHGFLAYLIDCAITGRPYTVFGYKGKQVRDNIHAADVSRALWSFYKRPSSGAVYNLGGARFSNCSMLEAIELCQSSVGRKLEWTYSETNRSGDHIWYISDMSRFKADYPEWSHTISLQKMIDDIRDALLARKS